ncbi:hypothetical protein IDG63_14465, partial [Staphylococcus sp. EG-SA-14]|nr:hypothetical protein [Staphylococcus sp. EG-SA-14]
NHDNMISSITTLGTPHNGTHASDLAGNEALVRQIVFDIGKMFCRRHLPNAFLNFICRFCISLIKWMLRRNNGY